MKTNLPLKLLALLLLPGTVSQNLLADEGTFAFYWAGGLPIPDNNASGAAFSFIFNEAAPQTISNVKVTLSLSGGWNGDLYAYLSHGSGFAVLLNRIGRTAANASGFSSSGLNAEFSDSYSTDIHLFGENPITGGFAPDGRNVNPFTVLNTDLRMAMLSSFIGLDPNGTWTLFLADLSPLATSTVQSWTVTIETIAVPEPGPEALMSLSLLLGSLQRILRSRGQSRRKQVAAQEN